MADEGTDLGQVLDRLEDAGGDQVSVNDVLAEFEDRSIGVLLMVFGLLAALPVVGDIPGASILFATLILLSILHSVTGKGRLRVPGKVGRKTLKHETVKKAVEKTRPWTDKVDRLLRPRLTALTGGRTARLALVIAAGLLAVSLYPLAVVPFGANAPAMGITLIGLALVTRDGIAALLGWALAGVTVWLLLTAL